MFDKTIQVSKFNSAEEFRTWWENPEVAQIRQAQPGMLEAHPMVKPWLEQGIASPEIKEEQFGKYRLLRKLGQGGMGTVYLAHDPALNRQVAIKTLQLEDIESTARFMREARSTAKLKHPNIVQVYDVGVVGKTYYLTMDYIEGASLADMLKTRDNLAPKRIAQIIHDIASALEYAHNNNIIHRDIKPGNILIDKAGKTYLTDFGLAKELSGLDRTLTMSGTILGTPDYMSPEQAIGKKDEIDARSDVFSLGATLYHALTGRLPFTGTELYEVMNKVINHDPPTPGSIIVVHKDLETICLKCLEKDKARRYQGMAELAEDLRRYIDGEPIQARRISAMTRIWRRVKKNKAVSISVAGAAVLLLAVLIGLAISSARTTEKLEAYRVEAYRLFGEKKYDEALIACEKIREITTEDGKINDLRQKCLAEIGQNKAQIKAREEQSERRSKAKDALKQAERASADQRIEIAKKALKIDPTFTEAYHMMGMAYAEKFDYPKAVECLTKAIELSPASASAYYERALIMTSWNLPEKAMADFEMVLKHDPESYMGYFAKGCLEGVQKKYDEAIKSYTKAIKMYPNYAQAYLNRAEIYSRKEEYNKAITDYTKAINLGPKNAVQYYNRGLAYENIKELDNAVSDYTEAISLDHRYADAYYRRGSLYQYNGNPDKAIADFNDAARFGYKHETVYFHRGLAYYKKNELDKAIADYDEALRINPQNSSAYYRRGLVYYDKRDWERAINDYTTAIRFNPQYALVYFQRGQAYYNKSEQYFKQSGEINRDMVNKAINDYTKTIQLNLKSAQVYNARAFAYCRNDEFDNAIADLTVVIKNDPNETLAYHNRSLIYAAKGMFKEAIADAKKFLKLEPKHHKAEEVKKLIEEWESKLK